MRALGWRRNTARRASDEAVFRRARLRLTLWYTATLTVIVVAFSLTLYAALAATLDSHQTDTPDQPPEQVTERQVTAFTLQRLRVLMVAGNVILLVGAAAGAHLLAGKTLRPVAEALARQRRFAADASHELRTPLTVMRGTLDVALQRERTADAYRTVLTELGDEVVEMSQLVEQLLRLARANLAVAKEPCAVAALLRDVVETTADLARQHGSQVTLVAGGSLVVQGDCTALRQIVLNLVTNALTHTPEGTAVEIEASHEHDDVQIAVIDHGGGIATTDRQHVFEPFYRSREATADGSGLGLALVHELVRAHQGKVAIQDTSGGGATVVVRLPAR